MSIPSENALGKWTVPECPFAIEYAPRVLDDVRLAVTDAFFSLPRGGAEIGGILLGRHEKGRIVIVDSLPIECEHALGPGFVLSANDNVKLADLVEAANQNPGDKPLGWWHSHTRSEIFLSEADQEIHNRFFPEPWQVALVLKPHTFQPMRAAFFFREKDGSIRADVTYQEFTLEPLPLKLMQQQYEAPPPGLVSQVLGPRHTPPNGQVIEVAPTVEPEPEPEPASEPPAIDPEPERPRLDSLPPPPMFATAQPESRRWIWWAALVLGIAIEAAFATRDRWIPRVQASIAPAAPEPLALHTVDQDGQLLIQWNSSSAVVRAASGATLAVTEDGHPPLNIELDRPHLQSGSFTYARHGARVDVTMLLNVKGKETREATVFSGALPPHRKPAAPAPAVPAPAPAADDGPAKAERDALRAENGRLKAEFGKQVERNKLLEKSMEELRKIIARDQARKRLEVQAPDVGKQ